MVYPEIPPKMSAWIRRRRGAARTSLELATSCPSPSLPGASSADVVIRVSHVALQYNSELLFKILPVIPYVTPPIPELEFTGTVVASGSAASLDVREVGTRVVAYQKIPDWVLFGRGALVEYVRVPSSQAAQLPELSDMAAMSGVLGSGSTALKIARTGSVGKLLVQVCKMRGAKVVGIASGGNEDMVRGLGADESVDYRKHDPLPAYLALRYAEEPFDFILDCVGLRDLYVHSPAYLQPDGMVISIGSMEGVGAFLRNWFFNTWWPVWLGGVPRRYVTFSTPPTKDDALVLIKMVEEDKLRVSVDSIFSMEDAISAYERLATKRARGRVIVKVGKE
ncbi:MAG: zinc ion binding [Tremellales sp. Tagirdzhanova-0007]|nr:MAG: zinc ion binding [Tremellales sp. Tagirdzhanova-0007]